MGDTAPAAPGGRATTWRQMPPPPEGRTGPANRLTGIAVRGAVLVGMGVVLAILDGPASGVGLIVLAVVLTVASLAVPAFARVLDRAAAWVGEAAATAVSAVGAGLTELFITYPGRLVWILRRGDPLTGLPRSVTSTWRAPVSSGTKVDRPYSPDVPSRRPPQLPTAKFRPHRILGVVAIFIAVDLVAGLVGAPDPPRTTAHTQTVVSAVEPVPGTDDLSGALLHSPAMKGSPWRRAYAREHADLTFDYQPFVHLVPRDQQGTFLNVVNNRRRSLSPPIDAARGPVVWFFGGSTVFGTGQRDDHTIPSEVARLARGARTPLQVVNFGVPGYTAFQEALALDQALAEAPAPDLVVFYDGANDIAVQTEYPSDQPTAFPLQVQPSEHPAGRSSLWERWAHASFLYTLWETSRGGPAGAVTRTGTGGARPGPEATARLAIGVYERSLALARRTAARHGVDLVTFFQPARFYHGSAVAAAFRLSLPAEVVDLSHALDGPGQRTYIDGVHTNEEGAYTVAVRVFDELRRSGRIRG